ncbi:MAG: hypothetical protein F6K28_50325, partial [Microcoleus sp. SIO2G3]|nr:hypothetical protein [Microcoleus sp. SIO2G3]
MVRDSNNDIRTARRLGTNPFRVVVREQIGNDDRSDFYQFRLTRSSFLNVSLRQYDARVRVRLLDASGDAVEGASLFTGAGLDVLLQGSLGRGTYYLQVSQRRSASRYRLRVNAIDRNEPGGNDPTPPPVTDLFRSINDGRDSSDPTDLLVADNFLYFAADDGVNGRELYRTNGRGNNLTRIDINRTGRGAGSDPRDLVNINGTIYFSATNGVTGRELYRITNTANQATLVQDINPGADDSNPRGLINFNNVLYFAATGVLGRELYRSDGTENGTFRVVDINPGSDSSNPTDFAVVGDRLYFAANNGLNGRELFSSNGTQENVALVADINTSGGLGNDAVSSVPTDLVNLNNVLYFAATDEIAGRELW